MNVLSNLRIAHSLTQEQIGKRTAIPYNTYRHYEYGDTFPSHRAIMALAELYSMLPGELFEVLVDPILPAYPGEEDLRAELENYRKWRREQMNRM